MTLGEKVRAARREMGYGYTQDRLAEDLKKAGLKNATRNLIASIETERKRGLYPDEVVAFAIVLNKSAEYFEDVDDGPNVSELAAPQRERPVPVRGTVTASTAVDYQPDEPHRGYTPFTVEWPAGGQLDALEVQGDSMEPTIRDKEFVIVRRGQDAREGSLVVARVDGQLYLKRLHRDGDIVELRCDNPKHKPRRYAGSAVEILGVAILAQPAPRRL